MNNLLFPEPISKRIINNIFSGKEVSWPSHENDLDEIIPYLIRFGFERIPGIRIRMEQAHITPDQIKNFKDYENYFPDITVIEMSEIGQNKFELTKGNYLSSRYSDLSILSDIVLREQVGEKNYRRSGMIKVHVSEADARAATLALAGHLKKSKLPDRILINQKAISPEKDPLIGDYFLYKIIIPTFELLGIKAEWPQPLAEINDFLSGGNIGVFCPGGKYPFWESIDLTKIEFIVSATSDKPTPYAIHIGDYYQNIGIYPIFGFNLPVFGLLRVVDSNNLMPRDLHGGISTIDRGVALVDRFVSAYEIPNDWSLIKAIFDQLYDLIRVTDLKKVPFKVVYETVGENTQNLLRETDLEKSINAENLVDVRQFTDIYSHVSQKYYENSVRLGVPSSTWMLKVRLPYAAKIDKYGILRAVIPLESGREGYVLSKSWKVKYSPEEMLFTNFNIVGSTEEVPKLVSSNIRNRVLDSLRGKDLFGLDNPGYIYSIAVISPKEFLSMISAARTYSFEPPKVKVTFKEIVAILSKLHDVIEEELEKSIKEDISVITLFALKTGIPLSEISEMVKRAKKDFIDDQGAGLKKILYAAFVDPQVDFETLPTNKLEDGLKVLQEREPFSPAFMVSPGNITLYDSFYLFAQLLFPALAEQSKNKFTIFIRPSESDITFNFLVFKFFEIAKQIDPQNEKGLRTLIQKAYWDPRYDEDFLSFGMENAEVGMYYGTAKTYTEARFRAAISKARSENFKETDIERLLEIAGNKTFQYNTPALEIASKEGIDNKLIQFVSNFVTRHKLYPETLNATIIMPDSVISQEIIESILSQTISLRGADCTNISKVWLPRKSYKEFMEGFEQEAGKLFYGDILNPATKLAQYDTDFLKTTKGIINSEDRRKDTRIIPPTNVNNGKRAEKPIDPNKNFTGVIITEIEAENLITGDPIDKDTYLRHLAGDLPLPWINFISNSSPLFADQGE